MRLRIRHFITATWEEPAALAMRSLRVVPRTYNGQYVRAWNIEVDRDCHQHRSTDGYGNIVHDVAAQGPLTKLDILAEGEVEVDDTAGVLKGSLGDRMRPEVYLRESPLTEPTPAIRKLAAEIREGGDGTPLDTCHRLMHAIHAGLEVLPSSEEELTGLASVSAETCLADGKGSPAALAHLYVAAVRSLGIPARYVSGYLFGASNGNAPDATHAWAEALIADLGWVGFDAVADRCPTEAYVRIASSVDQGGAAWIRGAERGGTGVAVKVESAIDCLGNG